MIQIVVGKNLCTVLEIFSVLPEQQSVFIKMLQSFTNSVARHKQGFVASNILKSLDGVRVVNYVQWTNVENYREAQASPEFQTNVEARKDLIKAIDANIYEVVFTNGEPAIIGKAFDRTIMLNLFSVAGGQHQPLLKTLVEFIDPIMRKQAGYLSTNFHRSLDGSRIFNYSYWTNPESYSAAEAMVNSTFAGGSTEMAENNEKFGSEESRQNVQVFMSAIRDSVEKVEPHLYSVIFSTTQFE